MLLCLINSEKAVNLKEISEKNEQSWVSWKLVKYNVLFHIANSDTERTLRTESVNQYARIIACYFYNQLYN